MKILRVTTVPSSLSILLKGQLLFMKKQGFEMLAVSSDGKEIKDLVAEEECRHEIIRMDRTINPFRDLQALIKMYKLIVQEKPVIVHSHTPKAGLIAMLAAYLAKVPFRLHTVAGLPLIEAKGFRRKLLVAVEKLTYACANKVYPNSKNLANYIIDNNFCKPVKIKVLGNGSSNGIDTEFFNLNDEIKIQSIKLKDELNFTNENFIFIYVGRLVKDKGIEELINAFIKLEKNYPNVRLLLVGAPEPELDPLSKKITQAIETNEKISTTGFQQDIRPFLAFSDALVFPTYREGFPNVPMQAGCFNLPAIVTDINGCNEIVENMENGIIIPPKDENALHNAMEKLSMDVSLYNYLKSNARRMIVERYDQKLIWSLILHEYRTLLQNNYHVS